MGRFIEDMQTGHIHSTKHNGDVKILKYTNKYEVEILFVDTGTTLTSSSSHIRSGYLKDPSVLGKLLEVGINDADYPVTKRSDIDDWKCPYYHKWHNMLTRCYCKAYQKKNPTYQDCTVCEEWLTFSNFRRWMEQQDWKGNHLDKDLLVTGNKIYSPQTCTFLHPTVNYFIRDGIDPLVGSSLCTRDNVRYAHCKDPFTKKSVNLGEVDNEEAGHVLWKQRKSLFAQKLVEAGYVTKDKEIRSLLARYK